jgi:hypothetical protein
MNLKFSEAEANMAQSFADKANLWQRVAGTVSIESQETDEDTLQIGVFSVTKVIDSKVRHSILGEQTLEAVCFVVTTELQEYSSDIGYSSDVAEIAREWTLKDALKACAHAQLEWALDAMEF